MGNTTNISKHCGEYPEIACNLGDLYPYCDMTCHVNSVAKKSMEETSPSQPKNGECTGMYHNMTER